MERLCRELQWCIVDHYEAAGGWCDDNGIDISGTTCSQDREHARADIERRIEEARKEDAARGPVATTVKSGLTAKAAELDALREAGRIMPEGLEWPRYEDGEPVRFGDKVINGLGAAFDVYRVLVKCDGAVTLSDYGNRAIAHIDKGERAKRPEPPDSWERLEEDAAKSPCAYFGHAVGPCEGCPAKGGGLCDVVKNNDIVRRAKALAKAGEGE